MTGLPPPNTRRWVARRKAAVVAAVSSGKISLEEACRRYEMSEDEFLTWRRAFETYGVNGLRATCPQQYRDALYPRITKPVSATENSLQQGFNSAPKEDLEGSSIPASLLPEKS
jgi:transposase-like protein